mmetsp:Transcript_15517/g.31529  ORF Transcript_15517/g.31529 Transcript_15517/m.31529 type:complete len:662 (+) Transcript_15517:43-2028(+)
MEIHRRARPSSLTANEESVDPSKQPKANGSSFPAPSRRAINSPYAPPTTSTTDAILLKVIQLLLTTAAVWFVYLIVAVNSPEHQIQTDLGSASESLRGSNSIQLKVGKADPTAIAAAKDQIEQVRNDFYMRYGGKAEATAMLKRGLLTFEKRIPPQADSARRATADRFLSTIIQHEQEVESQQKDAPEFVMAFAGYSVTVGRGNYFNQSFPFIMERILSPVFGQSPLGIKLTVRNSAIGGIPSFPYGWCLPNFLGEDAHGVSWDYAMNEGNGASGLESYIRQSLMSPNSPPLFVLVDVNSKPRLEILQTYADLGYLPDPVALGGKDAVNPKLLSLPEKDRPEGLQGWDEWGAPKGSPGQSSWHPKKKHHEVMGWMLAMHMLDAVDLALDIMGGNANWREDVMKREESIKGVFKAGDYEEVALPPPVTDVKKTGIESLLHGAPIGKDESKWHMHRISCRTSFLPNISGHLESIIESGMTKDDEDMLQSRPDSLFDDGWVMDVGKVERETKQKVMKYGGLGYIDMKTALYGIPSSGTLNLVLPYELPVTEPVKTDSPASKYFNAVVLCEVNEKRGDKECNMLADLTFEVGGVTVPRDAVSRIHGAASYLKKDICIHVMIPDDAVLSLKNGNEFGLAVDVTVTGSEVSRENGACSISHVIWEHT